MKKPSNEPYQEVLSFPETGEISLFKSKNYLVSVPVGLKSLPVSPVICVIDTGAGPILIQVDFLEPTWLDSVRQHDMPEIQSASNTKLTVSVTITVHLRMSESRTLVAFTVVEKLAVPVLLWITFINRFKKSVHQAERKISRTTPRSYPL